MKAMKNLSVGLLIIATVLLGMLACSAVRGENGKADREEEAEDLEDVTKAEPTALPTPVQKVPQASLNSLGDLEAGEAGEIIVIRQFANFTCSHCRDFFVEDFWRLVEDYVVTGDAVYIFYVFSTGSNTIAGEAAYCASEYGSFFRFLDTIYTNEWTDLDRETLTGVAEEIGLDVEDFSACLDDHRYQELVEADYALGQEYGITGIPMIFINDIEIVGNKEYGEYVEVIESLLE